MSISQSSPFAHLSFWSLPGAIRVIIVGLAWFLSQVLAAQTAPHPAFRQYTTDDGLASSEVYCIVQDRQGYIWISTDNGVSRFDGYSFRNYGVKEGLKENVIFVMQLDTLGRLWMQAMGGNLYYMNGDTIMPYRYNCALLDFKDRPDWSKGFILEGSGQQVFIASVKYGVIHISETGMATTLAHKEPVCVEVFETSGILLNAYCEKEDAGTYTEQLQLKRRCHPLHLQTSSGTWTFDTLVYTNTEGQAPQAFRLAAGQYLYKVYNDLWYLENGQVRWHRYFPFDILHAQLMPDGQLFLGIHRYQGLRVYPSVNALHQNEGTTWLPGKSVSYFMEDREGGHWFATNADGIFYTPGDKFMVHDRETGLPDEKVTALAVKNENELYAGLSNGEVWHLDRRSGIWTGLPALPSRGEVRDLFFDQNNQQLWAGRSKLFYLKNNNWALMAASYEGGSVSISNHITLSPNGERLWVCYFVGFMSIALPDLVPGNIHKKYGQRTFVVLEDYSGRVWVGKPDGLFEWKGDTLLGRQSLHPAFALRVEDMALLPDSTLVVATKGGGVLFWKGEKFEQITTDQGLTADMLECLWADGSGTVWAGTLNGLNRISGTWGHRRVQQITVSHGLPSNEINRIRTWGEDVWVATSKGLAHFVNKSQHHLTPVPTINSLMANGRSVSLKKAVILRPSENNLTIAFSAINFKMNGQILYRYRMDGSPWYTTLNRSLNFPQLPPGERLFEVQAQNEDGVWSQAATLCFEILPPWWATWWAKTAALLAFALAGPLFYKYRMRRVREVHQIELQMAELERSALQAQMNPHFIFNCLNSIQNFILQNEKESAISYLGSFAALVRSMLNASVSGSIALADEIKLLNNYLALEKLRFKDRFDFEVTVAEGIDVYEVKIPPLLIQPYVENAVLHGMANKEAEGKVAVHFEKKKSFVEITVEDNGPGMSKENVNKNPGPAHKSVGMSITKERLEMLAKNGQNSEVRIEPGSACGTVVHIRIELEDSH